jgi:tetratricopeptide (TPR) repeat protein
MKSGRLAEASKELDDTLERERNPLYRMLALSMKGLLLLLSRKDKESSQQEALTLLSQAESLAASLPEGIPSRGLPWFAKGVLFSSIDRHEEALQAYRRSEQMEAPRATVVVSKGQSLLALEDYPQALSCFERAMEMPSDRAGVHFDALVGQGLAWYKQEQYEKAVVAYRGALEQQSGNQPEVVDAWSGLAEAYAALGRYQAAIDTFRRALAVSDSAARTAARAGWIFLRSHRDEEALHFLAEAKRRGYAGAQVEFNRGVALYRLKRLPEAREAWKAAAQAGSEEARTCLRELARRAPGAAELLDYWFGEDRTRFRRSAGVLLVAMAFLGGVLPVLKVTSVPWIQPTAPWPVITFPAMLALGLLLLPVLSSIKLGPVELKLAPVEPPVPLPHASIEAVIDQALSSRGALTPSPLGAGAAQQESADTKVYTSYAVASAVPLTMPIRVER